MYEPTLFDKPTARATDPQTSHQAAAIMKPANAELIRTIRAAIKYLGPSTAFTIARHIEYLAPGRWQPDTIRTACNRAHLTKHPGGTSPGGRPAVLYSL